LRTLEYRLKSLVLDVMAQRTEGVATAPQSEVVAERFPERRQEVLPKVKEREACREEEEARPKVWSRVEA
jgi:hypothetical protein